MSAGHGKSLIGTHCAEILHQQMELSPVAEHAAVAAVGDQLMRELRHTTIQIVHDHSETNTLVKHSDQHASPTNVLARGRYNECTGEITEIPQVSGFSETEQKIEKEKGRRKERNVIFTYS
jgi:hypothetical protein